MSSFQSREKLTTTQGQHRSQVPGRNLFCLLLGGSLRCLGLLWTRSWCRLRETLQVPEMLDGADTCLLASVHSFTLNPCSPYPASGGELLGHALNFPFAPPNALLSGSLFRLHPPQTVHSALLRKERARSQSVQEHKLCLSHASHHGPRGPLHSAPECRIRPIALPKTYSKYSGLRRPYPLEANFVPSSARAIIAKFARQSPFLTCAGKEPARVALTPGPPGAARSPGRTGESP